MAARPPIPTIDAIRRFSQLVASRGQRGGLFDIPLPTKKRFSGLAGTDRDIAQIEYLAQVELSVAGQQRPGRHPDTLVTASMCGRYTLAAPTDLLVELFELAATVEVPPRFNIAPTQEAAVVRADGEGGERRLDLLRWGLIPFWAKDPDIGHRMINARAETVAEKPAYRTSFRKRRCLVIADGFYEWQRTASGPKQPFYLRMPDGRPFALAGLWDRWDKGEGGALETFTILTTSPNAVVEPIHSRMPVILRPADFASWLDPGQSDPGTLAPMLVSTPSLQLDADPVSTYVNNPANEGARCVEPAG